VRTSDLIHDLARQGSRVRPTPHYLVRFTVWVAASILCMALGILALGIRSDLAAEWHSGTFLVQAALAIGLAAASAGSALLLSVPGKTNSLHIYLPAALLLAWVMLLVGSFLTASHMDLGQGLHCARNIVALTLIPGFLLYCILRAAAPLRSSLVGLLAALGAASLGCLATRFVCQVDDPLHILVWHYLPILGLSAVGGLIGRLVFSNNR
jgi:hypothetical protein